jgi:hypothetical protein
MPRARSTEDLCRQLVQSYPGADDAIEIYTGSLVARLREADYALSMIRLHATGTATQPNPILKTMDAYLCFYLNAFWTLLYSVFDITAHVINAVHPRVPDEQQVAFGQAVRGYPNARRSAAALPRDLQNVLQEISRRRYFTRLKKYRECTLHRRAVEHEKQERATTLVGPRSSSPTKYVEDRVICDDPSAMIAKFDRRRSLTEECSDLRRRTEKDIRKILRLLVRHYQ